MKNWCIEFDVDYGYCRRTGYSLHYDYRLVVELFPNWWSFAWAIFRWWITRDCQYPKCYREKGPREECRVRWTQDDFSRGGE